MQHSDTDVQFTYMYRDADNYKTTGAVIFPNPDSFALDEARCRLEAVFESGNLFRPERVAIPRLSFGTADPDRDHDWNEFVDLELEQDAPRYGETTRDARTLRQFVEAVEAAAKEGWDDVGRTRKPGVGLRATCVIELSRAAAPRVAQKLIEAGQPFQCQPRSSQVYAFTVKRFARSLVERAALQARLELIGAALQAYFRNGLTTPLREQVDGACHDLTAKAVKGNSFLARAVRAWLKYEAAEARSRHTLAAERQFQIAAAYWSDK